MLAMALPLLVGLQVAGAAVGGVGGGRKFNVLLMLSDDLRPELGAFGAAHIHSTSWPRGPSCSPPTSSSSRSVGRLDHPVMK